MIVIDKWTRTEVRALRIAALRITQEELAETLGFNVETIQKWERKTRADRPVVRKSAAALDEQLRRLNASQLERFRAALANAPALQDGHSVLSGNVVSGADESPRTDDLGIVAWEVEDEVKRREFGKLATAGAVAVFLPESRGRIGMSDVQRLLAGVDALDQEDQRKGGAQLVDVAVEKLAHARDWLETGAFDPVVGNAFTSATGELAVLAGWLAYDGDRHQLARRCFADAMALGTEADDSDLIAHTCLYAANQSCSLARAGLGGSPHKALQLSARARDMMRGRPPGRIHALIAVREAQAYGLLGDRRVFGRAVATAWRELEQAMQFEPLEEVPQWLRFVTYSEIADHEARGYADMGDLRRSVDLYATAVDRPAKMRNATIVRAWSAATRARLGDISGALEHGFPALVDLSAIASTRTLRRLEPVRTAVDRLPAGAEFRDLYDALTQKAITA
ncbi:helix-turn-helix domain-containing protein [Nocardia abscessus]|uniref:helix-turn-helix domain-containing protein n=1 Tax=Nocardia abscessus TaxID=120957 RepID=UPI002454E788|nr:helix-turn-helix domain-containing protein [Nocardia abscessus]